MRTWAKVRVAGAAGWMTAAAVAATAGATEPAGAPAPAPAPLTAADFVREPQYLLAKISPDGRYLAVTYPKQGVYGLGIIDLQTMKMAGSLQLSHQQFIYDVWWVSSNRVVVAMAKSYGPLDPPSLTGELYGMDADGSSKQYLYGYQARQSVGTHIGGARREYLPAFFVSALPNDPVHALIAVSTANANPDFQLNRLDVMTGLRTPISTVPGLYPYRLDERHSVVADNDGQPRYAVSLLLPDQLAEHVRAPDGNGWKTVFSGADQRTSIVGLAPDGGSVYLSRAVDGNRLCLVSRNLSTLATETMACNEHVDLGAVTFVPRGQPIAVRFEDGLPQTRALGDSLQARAMRTLQKSFAGQRVTITSMSSDGNKMVVQVDSDRNPGDFYLFDLERRKLDFLLSLRPWIDPERMAPATPIELKARDGLRLDGYITSRQGLAKTAQPLVVIPHGGPHGVRDSWSWDPWAQYFAAQGYAVLQLNFRGSGGYGADHESAGYRHWGDTMQDDLTDAVRWAAAAGIVDPGRVCIMGASYGGYAALMSAVREPERYRCAVALAGVFDLSIQAHDSVTSNSRFGRAYLAEVLGTSEDDYRRHSPLSYLGRLKIPVLIAHGTADERVPFKQAKALRAELDRLHKPYEWMPFDGEEHGLYATAHHVKFLEASRDFIARAIGPGSVPPPPPP